MIVRKTYSIDSMLLRFTKFTEKNGLYGICFSGNFTKCSDQLFCGTPLSSGLVSFVPFFKSIIWVPQDQLWGIGEGTVSLACCKSLRFILFDPKVTRSLVMRLSQNLVERISGIRAGNLPVRRSHTVSETSCETHISKCFYGEVSINKKNLRVHLIIMKRIILTVITRLIKSIIVVTG